MEGVRPSQATSMLDTSSTPQPDAENGTSFFAFYLEYLPTYMLWVIVPPVLLVLGCFGNVMTIVVMRAMRASESTACLSVYFTALALSDLCLLCSFVIWEWPEIAFKASMTFFYDISCALPFFMVFCSSMMSAWFLMAMTAQRLISVVVPHRVALLCTVKTGKLITAAIVVVSVGLNSYFFVIYQVKRLDSGYEACISTDEVTANIFRFVHLSLASVIPFVFLIVANSVLISRALRSVHISRTMKDQQQTSLRSSRTSSMTVTLILTSAAFLVLTLPTCLMDFFLEIAGFFAGAVKDVGMNQLYALGDSLCIFLWISNSAVNFYIYILSGRKFRHETKRYLCQCFQAGKTPATMATST